MKTFILAIISMVVLSSCQNKPEKVTKDKILIEIAKQNIKGRAVSPSSVIFHDSTASVLPFNHNGKGTKQPDRYNVRITYEAKNRLGVLLENRAWIMLEYIGSDSLDPKAYKIKEL